MSRSSHLTILAILLPIICITAAVWMVVYETRRMSQLNDDMTQTEKQIAMAESLARQIHDLPINPHVPTAGDTVHEEPQFLTNLRLYADSCHVKIVKWYKGIAQAPTSTSRSPSSNLAKPSSVTPKPSVITVSGNYGGIRDFLYSLAQSPRLFSLTDIRWVRGDKWPITNITFTLIRYVSNQPVDSGSVPAVAPQQQTVPNMKLYPNPAAPVPPIGQYAPAGSRNP